MSYQLAFSTLGCPTASLDEALAIARNYRLPAIELRAAEGSIDLPAVLTRAYASPPMLAVRLRAEPVRIAALDSSFKLTEATPADCDDLLKLAAWAEAIGTPWLRIFDGNAASATTEAAATMQWWHQQRQRHGWRIDLMVETHDSLLSADAVLHFLSAAPGTTFLWDTHHTWRHGHENPTDTWRKIRGHIAHIHVKDSVSQQEAGRPYAYVLPGTGEFPMQPLQQALAAEFSGTVSLEWERMWHPNLPPLESALDSAAAHGWW